MLLSSNIFLSQYPINLLLQYLIISISNINRPMLHRSSKSIAHLQHSMVKELSHFSVIHLTLSRKSCTSLRKHHSFSLKRPQKSGIKVDIIQSKAVKNTPKVRKNPSSKNSKQIIPMCLQLKSAKTSKLSGKLKKKTLKLAKKDNQFENSSLGSTNLLDSKATLCSKCCENVERNTQYQQKIRQQKQLIDKLQSIINLIQDL